MLKYRLLRNGGFVAGDTVTRRTSYAYPASPNAVAAITEPARTAAAMMAKENAFKGFMRLDYDADNWNRLEDAP